MTFSDSRVVKMLQDNFIPVWESVAPVKIATFDLGEGRSVKGTISGEIAIYFCTEEGKVFDVLPALQSPAATLKSMKEALAFYNRHDGKPDAQALRDFHLARIKKEAGDRYDESLIGSSVSFLPEHEKSKQGIDKRERAINEAVDRATRDMRFMVMSKTYIPPSASSTSITIVEPGGRGYYLFEVDRRFLSYRYWTNQNEAGLVDWVSDDRLSTPAQWAKELFPHVLKQPLEGGNVIYDSDSLEAIRIINE